MLVFSFFFSFSLSLSLSCICETALYVKVMSEKECKIQKKKKKWEFDHVEINSFLIHSWAEPNLDYTIKAVCIVAFFHYFPSSLPSLLSNVCQEEKGRNLLKPASLWWEGNHIQYIHSSLSSCQAKILIVNTLSFVVDFKL